MTGCFCRDRGSHISGVVTTSTSDDNKTVCPQMSISRKSAPPAVGRISCASALSPSCCLTVTAVASASLLFLLLARRHIYQIDLALRRLSACWRQCSKRLFNYQRDGEFSVAPARAPYPGGKYSRAAVRGQAGDMPPSGARTTSRSRAAPTILLIPSSLSSSCWLCGC